MSWLSWLLPKKVNDNWEETNQSVTQRKRVGEILERVRKTRALLTVNISGAAGSFTSALLHIDPRTGLLSIDELNPDSGHELMQPGAVVAIHAKAPGMDAHFRTTVSSIEVDRDIYFYQLHMPEEVYYAQRREYDRVRLSGTAKLIIAHPEVQMRGMLFDVSASGVGAIVHSDIRLNIDERHTCFIELPSERRIIAQVIVRYVKPDPKPGYWRLGLELIELGVPELDAINRTIRRSEQS